jgi:hypothetical protein
MVLVRLLPPANMHIAAQGHVRCLAGDGFVPDGTKYTGNELSLSTKMASALWLSLQSIPFDDDKSFRKGKSETILD